jgi:hypothetical protein
VGGGGGALRCMSLCPAIDDPTPPSCPPRSAYIPGPILTAVHSHPGPLLQFTAASVALSLAHFFASVATEVAAGAVARERACCDACGSPPVRIHTPPPPPPPLPQPSTLTSSTSHARSLATRAAAARPPPPPRLAGAAAPPLHPVLHPLRRRRVVATTTLRLPRPPSAPRRRSTT